MNPGSMTEIWVYLSTQPLLWLTLTLAAYLVAIALHRKSGGHPAVNPVLISVAILVCLLMATGTPEAIISTMPIWQYMSLAKPRASMPPTTPRSASGTARITANGLVQLS